jgi:SAM-dependent methyltransferase
MQIEQQGHAPTAAGFDGLSTDYEALLRDPVRDRFAGTDSEFFHVRKRDLIRQYFRQRRRSATHLSYLDVGCGKGELLGLLQTDFREIAGCDPSGKMLESVREGIEARQQGDPLRIPFETERFDFVSAVCVYHHVPPREREQLTREVARVLRPSGIFCIIEHNPLNPITRLIVSRTPVDADAILLKAPEARSLMQDAGLIPQDPRFFLYFPSALYHLFGRMESKLGRVPLGGQYAVFGEKSVLPLNTTGPYRDSAHQNSL